ncbi:hypothetical protein SDC9_162588 [bioreactor metagenome]|uniref:Uncharacterized protein n=1 Tax=bioreactor metagenome TaxID=1076179 RepID=A0A645FLH0_9ZZZZ
MRYIIYSKSKEVFSFTLSAQNREILANVCEAYLITQLEYDFPTLRFYKTNFQNETF